MDNPDIKKSTQEDQYWQKMDEFYASAEKKNLLIAINRTDTEKFYLFTAMMRINNTLKKVTSHK